MRNKFYSVMVLTVLVALTACSSEDSNLKTYDGSIRVKTLSSPQDSMLVVDEVLMENLENEYKSLLKVYSDAFGTSNGKFTLEAESLDDLKALVAAKCNTLEKSLQNKTWSAAFAVMICNEAEENRQGLYSKEYGQKSAANGYMDWAYCSGAAGMNPPTSVATSTCAYGGWLCWGYDCNDGCGTFFDGIYLHFKMDTNQPSITDFVVMRANGKTPQSFTLRYEGRLYKMSQHLEDSDGNLNQDAGGDMLYLMYTTDATPYSKWGNIYFGVGQDSGKLSNYRIVPLVDSKGKKIDNCANLNSGTSGEIIYLCLQ